ncbi:hypothetical protein HYH03_012000 [Edaphochlamys debaryana]|uniref:SET domain-containing protein n=1 Tax=Edaphochlamys debaryana TaxID=47281 RepID=A0A836BVZ1_9CHLO|nr:hypothetical protein HYH03_012000 [Edaphochlamys debaryana]|eukprot:KAG2489549.1 hypothetical protein HYH03_012000 [Edaphochlamys debaryana]
MWRALMGSRFAAWVIGFVSLPKARQLQQELDTQRLYILTQVYKAAQQGRTPNMQQLLLTSQSSDPVSLRAAVDAALRTQVLGTAEALHGELLAAGDPAAAASRMAAAEAQRLRRREAGASGFSKLLSSLRGGTSAERTEARVEAGPGPGPSSEAAAAAGGAGSRRAVSLSQAELAAALRRRAGFSLELRPSSVPHPEAGTGLFIQGEARAGAVVAIFPGVLYGRTQLSHMPNYPKIDTDNPYLSCRYDQSIMDSKPWAQGDPGGAASANAPASPSGGSGSSTDPGPAPAQSWWTWAGPLSASLGLLEGRHPLALGHWVNHPGPGQQANVLEASLDLALDDPGPGPGPGPAGSGPGASLAARPWLRAYLPVVQPPVSYDPYGNNTDPADDEDSDDEDGDEYDERRAAADKAGRKPASPAPASTTTTAATTATTMAGDPSALPKGRVGGRGGLRPWELQAPPGGVVRLLVLVATRPLRDGEELLQDYRMNPSVKRPDWYVVHDPEAEERKWARSQVLDRGAGGRRQQQQPAGGARPGEGGGGGGGSGGAFGAPGVGARGQGGAGYGVVRLVKVGTTDEPGDYDTLGQQKSYLEQLQLYSKVVDDAGDPNRQGTSLSWWPSPEAAEATYGWLKGLWTTLTLVNALLIASSVPGFCIATPIQNPAVLVWGLTVVVNCAALVICIVMLGFLLTYSKRNWVALQAFINRVRGLLALPTIVTICGAAMFPAAIITHSWYYFTRQGYKIALTAVVGVITILTIAFGNWVAFCDTSGKRAAGGAAAPARPAPPSAGDPARYQKQLLLELQNDQAQQLKLHNALLTLLDRKLSAIEGASAKAAHTPRSLRGDSALQMQPFNQAHQNGLTTGQAAGASTSANPHQAASAGVGPSPGPGTALHAAAAAPPAPRPPPPVPPPAPSQPTIDGTSGAGPSGGHGAGPTGVSSTPQTKATPPQGGDSGAVVLSMV